MLHKDLLARLCRARDLLRDPQNNEQSIREIARCSGISSFHFIRIFRAAFGQTPHQCRIDARLHRARQLLIVTDRSVTDICFEAGFSSLGTFSWLFTGRFGVSPSKYRKRIRPMQTHPGEMPPPLIPGCLTLMGSPPANSAIFKKQPAQR
jgi:AraC-like DNA-binding protein